MIKKSLITAAAVAIAGVATYFIRKKMVARNNKKTEEPSSGDNRHVTNAFSRAKTHATGATEEL